MRTNRHAIFSAVCALAGMALCACTGKTFTVNGTITQARDSVLYLEHMSLNGPVVTDSATLDESGHFSFRGEAPSTPEFYRLRIAGQIVNLAVDSTEQITVTAQYPTMSAVYDIKGSAECATVKELALRQMELQRAVDATVAAPELGVEAVRDSVSRLLEAYKEQIKTQYIFPAPMRASAYYALFQTIRLGNMESLIFNPRTSEQDVKVFAAVATSWDTYYPQAERGENLHNIAIEGMKTVRIMQQQQAAIDPSLVNVSNVIDIALRDNHGNVRRLTDLADKVVLLDFQLFEDNRSTERIMMLRELYNKYHAQGFEIYQVSYDSNEHFWKTKTAALPWVNVRDDQGIQSEYLVKYNIQSLPTYFLVGRHSNLHKRDAQIDDVESEIRQLLKQ